jgi:GNAT superfamily N-acetyltransferase
VDGEDVEIREAISQSEETDASLLMADYLAWGASQLRVHHGVDPPVDPTPLGGPLRQRAAIEHYRPPMGRLLVAYAGDRPVGVGALRRLPDGAAEIKRMYVVPDARSLGVGSRLVDRLLEAAAQTGATVVRLDTADFMDSAHRLYRSRGFCERPPYEGSEIPAQLHEHWLFFERRFAEP